MSDEKHPSEPDLSEVQKLYNFRMLPADYEATQRVFKSLGLGMSSGIRLALAEFRKKHAPKSDPGRS